MKKIITLLSIVFLGCGGGGSTTTIDDTNTSTSTTPIEYNVTDMNEPLLYQQWSIEYNKTFYESNKIDPNANIHAGDLLTKYSGAGVKIAIIDDYLDINQEDLKDGIYKTYSIITNSDKLAYVDNAYHGTAVTGIIGARSNHKGILGIAYNSQLIFIQMKDTPMTESEMIEMFEKAKDDGADIINCSWGTYTQSDALSDEIQDLITNGRDKKGIPVVFAIGNDNTNMDNVEDESKIPGVIAVGATDSDNYRAEYSNYGSNLMVMAPGGYYYGITTTDISGIDGYTTGDYDLYDDNDAFAGTSAAAPIVSGVIALMLEKNPNLTYDEIVNIIKNDSDKIGDYEYIDGRNDYYGYGKVNLENYLNAVK